MSKMTNFLILKSRKGTIRVLIKVIQGQNMKVFIRIR